MSRTKKWLAGTGLFLLLLVTAAYFFDWNLARPYIARKVSGATGRSFAINGNLDVHLSLRPRIIVNDVVMGNAAWSKDPLMARLKHADFKIDLLKLFGGHLSFPEITLSELQLVLEENSDGKQNWVFDQQGKPQEFPNIDSLAIDHGTLKYRDATENTDLTLEVNTADAIKDDPENMLELTGKGRFKGMETALRARGGALLTLRSADQPYPIKANATLGTTKVSIDGTVDTMVDAVYFGEGEGAVSRMAASLGAAGKAVPIRCCSASSLRYFRKCLQVRRSIPMDWFLQAGPEHE